jgi:hypothetical protein
LSWTCPEGAVRWRELASHDACNLADISHLLQHVPIQRLRWSTRSHARSRCAGSFPPLSHTATLRIEPHIPRTHARTALTCVVSGDGEFHRV